MQIFTLIPSETKLSILLLVIVPAITVGFLRLRLHIRLQKMNNRISRLLSGDNADGIQPPIVDRLKDRYRKASKKLEHVNTIALIDSVYKDETLSYWWLKIQYDQAESITRVLPNLLIAFGLIGTFLGITSNLTNISSVITSLNTSNPDIGKLVQGLQPALRDMGVAFSASLFGLSFGSLLTIFNTIWNTNVAKHQLIAGLEDYLDNIYKPTVEGNTRLDTAIDRMVQQQQEFLLRFHENVGRALETSFGKAANQIAAECSRINQIAENVYTNFSNAAGTISTGATTFELAANSLQSQNQVFTNSLQEFKTGVATFQTAAHGLEQNNIVQNIDRVLTEIKTTEQDFAQSTQSLLSTQQGFTQSSQFLQSYLEEIKSSNQQSFQLAQQVYEGLQTSNTQIGAASNSITTGATAFERAAASLITQTQTVSELVPEFRKGITSFVTAANKVQKNNIIQDLNNAVASLDSTQQAFTNSTQILQGSLTEITSSNQQIAQLAQQVYRGLETSTDGIKEGSNTFITAARIISDSFLAIDLSTATNSWLTTQADFANSTATFKQATEDFQSSAQLKPAVIALDTASKSIQIVGEKVTMLSENNSQIAESIQAAISEIDQKHQDILQNTKSSVSELSHTHQSTLQDLKNALVGSLSNEEVVMRNHQIDLMKNLENHLVQLNNIDQESLQRIIKILEKLEIKNENSQHKNGWLGTPNFRMIR
jgi:hypothetical protein